jgi:hypothetical protein
VSLQLRTLARRPACEPAVDSHPGAACCRQGPGWPAASARIGPVLRRSGSLAAEERGSMLGFAQLQKRAPASYPGQRLVAGRYLCGDEPMAPVDTIRYHQAARIAALEASFDS